MKSRKGVSRMQDFKGIAYSVIMSFVISMIIAPIVLPMLQKLKVGQSIREEGPQSHFKKSGTPTMGGVIIIGAAVFTALTSGRLDSDMIIMMIATLGFGLIGFVDDFIKVVLKRNLGLRAYQKLIGQIMIAGIVAVYMWNQPEGTFLFLPFTNRFLNLGILYIPFIIFVILGTNNGANLTDGLDGLAAGVSIIVLSFFTFAALYTKNYSIAVFCGAMIGGSLGFLRYNSHPAQVFMGDTGSLALGGAIVAAAVLLKLPLLLPIAAGVFMIETLSVIAQVISFKTTGKRIFKMSPLHHHFELSGWHETKIVMVFWIFSIILVLVSVLAVGNFSL